MTRVGFLGPHGTFAEEALLTQPDLAAGEAVPFRDVPHVITAVERGEVDLGLVPIENSIEGSITVTLDTLAFDTELLVQREVDLPVSLHLCAPKGTKIRDITTVVSHPNPLGQTRMWMAKHLPDAVAVAANSTAEAALQVAKARKSRAGTNTMASIGTRVGAANAGLDILASEIEDHPENQTRFVLVGYGVPAPTGHDKTSVVCFQRHDRPGSLLAILQEFAARAINITKLESRPTKRDLGDYCFFIDFEGHLDDDVVADCLRNLAAKQAKVKFLGSYPVSGADGHARRKAVTKAERDANAWLGGLRDQIRREGRAVIDLKRLREEPDYRVGIERKRVEPGLIDDVLAADAARREQLRAVEELRTRQNAASKDIGRAAPDERPAKIAAAGALKEELQALEEALAPVDAEVRALALRIPNPADASVPDGGEHDGAVLRIVGDTPAPPPLDHAAFSEAMGWVESEQAVQMSGSRFAYLMREAVLLELALVQWVTRTLVGEGFTPVVPPVLVREEAMVQAGFFPTDDRQVYAVEEDELFLVGTSEVPLSAIHRDEILPADGLPRRYLGISSCFRREAGTYGKDTRGIFRVHQFDKVEMFSYADPATSWDEHEALLAIEESLVGGLGLPYRVVNIAAGDLGAAAAKKYDVEVWLPSEGAYRELTSCSNYLDFSARRLNTRVRGEGANQLAHTLNGTACAVGRTLVFLFEHYQDADGGFTVPEVLRPYTGFDRVEPR